jgi:DNA processing protein
VAVLGCGVDVVYPPQHHELYERLCRDGLVLSEYPPGTPPLKEQFPQRNRIIAGLARGTLVVEAPMGSGALITARLANAQGREVFALPGPLASPLSKGCHMLIKQGQAKLVESVDDMLAEFNTNRAILLAERFGSPRLPLEVAAAGAAAVAEAAPPRPPLQLEAGERSVLDALSYEGTHVNDVVRKLGITTAECISHLTMLEIKGLITSASGGYYIRV